MGFFAELTFFFFRNKVDDLPTIYCGCASPIKFVDVLHKVGISVPKHFTEYLDTIDFDAEYCHALPSKKEEWCEYLFGYISDNMSDIFK